MTDPPNPPSEPEAQEEQENPLDAWKREIEGWHEYDEFALDQYRSLSYYFSRRRMGATKAQAATMTCEVFGHDAPRGLCRRCLLGVDITKPDEQAKKRVAERDTFLASRHG